MSCGFYVALWLQTLCVCVCAPKERIFIQSNLNAHLLMFQLQGSSLLFWPHLSPSIKGVCVMLLCMRLHRLIMFLLIIALYFYANNLLFHYYCCSKHLVSLVLNNLAFLQRHLLLRDVNKSSNLQFPSVLLLYVRLHFLSLVRLM